MNRESARVVMFPGGDKDGWFTNNRVILQLKNAVEIVEKNYPQFTHKFVYDNAPSHTKHSLSSLSAQGMPKNPLMDWPYYKNDKKERVFVRMEDGQFPDGSPQSFYDPNEATGRRFKGMAWILQERGLAHLAERNSVCSLSKVRRFSSPAIMRNWVGGWVSVGEVEEGSGRWGGKERRPVDAEDE